MSYDKVRYDRLCRVTEKSIEQTVKNLLNSEHLEKCFPRIAQMEGGKSALETARKQMMKYFRTTCTKQFDYIFEQRDIHRKLDELDEIIQDAQKRRDDGNEEAIFIERLTPEQLINGKIGSSRSECVKKLEMIHNQLLLDNAQLFDQLQSVMEQGKKTKDDIASHIDALASGIDDLKKQDFDDDYDALIEVALLSRRSL